MRIARPHGRARIETVRQQATPSRRARIARPHGRARIETNPTSTTAAPSAASPGLTVGRGLKRRHQPARHRDPSASPGLTVGRGLKPIDAGPPARRGRASPGLTVGRGLKRAGGGRVPRADPGIARPHGRARIETAYSASAAAVKLASPGLTVGRGLKHQRHVKVGALGVHRPASRSGAD